MPDLKAFVHVDLARARNAADEATARYQSGTPLSPIDGLPIGIKDVIETEDLPTEFGSEIYKDYQPHMDAAVVYWLKKAGAYVLGKTVTTEFAALPPGPTRNPWNLAHSPGGSSSGSAAAVAARMLPVATGTQVRGSVLRPAAYCGVFAFKPSLGTVNLQGLSPISRSINHLGILAGSLADCWITTRHISVTTGGEPGQLPLEGPVEMPEAKKPATLIKLETPGWQKTPENARQQLDDYLETLRQSGIVIKDRNNDKDVAAYENAIGDIVYISDTLRSYENRYPNYWYLENHGDQLRPETRDTLENTEPVSLEAFTKAHHQANELRNLHAALISNADGFITLNSVGVAPEGMSTGNPIYGDACSVIGAPALNLPLLSSEDLPLGVQLIGFYREDAALLSLGRWLAENYA
jgi:Asp-tRNA(Asn)/Glu-tRNA(Gln) amidotransferase A subunit family amidase